MKNTKFAIIGAGNMGSSIAEGLLKTGVIPSGNIFLADQRTQPLEYFKTKGVKVSHKNTEAAAFADVIIIAVKPFLVKTVLEEIKPSLNVSRQILISIAAGISIREIENVTETMPIFRAIPNTAIAIQESMTCIAEANSSKEQQDLVLQIFGHLGKAVFIQEDLMNAATIIGSCETAFVMRFIRAAVEGGVEIGFKPDVAQQIISQTALGAARLLLESGNHPEAEIDKVTTPKGITIVGLNEMEKNGFSSSVIQGILSAYHKVSK